MSSKLVAAVIVLGVAFSAGSASAYEKPFDFGQVWGDAVSEHKRDEALSASPRDAMRHHPQQVYGGRPHDPSGTIILEGAR